jgi:glycerophosphoryl diester phosphodiesterase
MRALAPSIPTVFLTSWPGPHHHERRLPNGAVVLGPWLEWVRSAPHEVERLRERGVPIHVWTVDDVADIALCVELGVDAIISNRPDAVLTYLGR